MWSSRSDRSSSVWSVSSSGISSSRAGGRVCLQGEEPSDDQADEDGGDQVECDRRGRGDGRVRRRRPRVERSSAVRLETLHHLGRGGDQNAGEGSAGDLGDPACGRDQHDDQQHQGVGQRGQPGRRPGPTLTAVRAIAAVAGMPPKSGAPGWPGPGRRVRGRSRGAGRRSSRRRRLPRAGSPALPARQPRRPAGAGRRGRSSGTIGQRRAPAARYGMWPIGAAPQPRMRVRDGRRDHRDQRAGEQLGANRGQGQDSHDRDAGRRSASGAQTGIGRPGFDGAGGEHQDLLRVHVDAECGGHLLQRDDHRDADVKPSTTGTGRSG